MISMAALAWTGIMIIAGVVLRAKVPFLRNNLVPASVIGGVIGLIVMNLGFITDCTVGEFGDIVNLLWIFTFANMGVTLAAKKETVKTEDGQSFRQKLANSQFSGICGMGFIWVIPYAFSGLIGFLVLQVIGKYFGMPAIHGLQLPFAFAQGPGQSVNYGGMMEANGVADAVQVGVTFAAMGFLVAFLIGVPYAKKGIKKGLAPYSGKIGESMLKGLYEPDEQEFYGKQTTHPGNVDTLAFHVALVGIAWVGGMYIGKLWALVPGYIGTLFSGFLYLNSMLCGYVIRWIIGKLGLSKYLDRGTQIHLSGFCIDMMVTSAFMAISLEVVGKWLVPILILVLITTVFTYIITRYFGERMGGKYGFERSLGVWGAMTGTNATGQALVRMVDPDRKTTVLEEMGPMNVINVPACYVVMPAVIAYSAGEISTTALFVSLIGVGVAFMAAMLVTGVWGKKTYDYRKGELYYSLDDETEQKAAQ